MALVSRTVEGRVAHLRLALAEQANPLTQPVLDELTALLDGIALDDGVSCVVISGDGEAFSIGSDVGSRSRRTSDHTADHARLLAKTRSLLCVWDFPKPIVVAAHGQCLAGAVLLLAAADLAVVADDLVLGWTGLPLGGGWVDGFLARVIGMKNASELSYVAGSCLTATDVRALGLANHIVRRDALIPAAMRLAAEVAETPRTLLMIRKRAIRSELERAGWRTGLVAGVELDVIAHSDAVSEKSRAELVDASGGRPWFAPRRRTWIAEAAPTDQRR